MVSFNVLFTTKMKYYSRISLSVVEDILNSFVFISMTKNTHTYYINFIKSNFVFLFTLKKQEY